MSEIIHYPHWHNYQPIFGIQAGPEVGVATTKVFTAQLFCLGCITALLTNQKEEHLSIIESLKQIPAWISGALETGQTFEKVTQFISDETMLFCARNESFPVAQEAALKIKELAYIMLRATPLVNSNTDHLHLLSLGSNRFLYQRITAAQ